MNPAGSHHIPVLGREAIEMLGPRDGGVYVDATFGAGGYSRAMLASPEPASSASTATARRLPAASIWSIGRAAG